MHFNAAKCSIFPQFGLGRDMQSLTALVCQWNSLKCKIQQQGKHDKRLTNFSCQTLILMNMNTNSGTVLHVNDTLALSDYLSYEWHWCKWPKTNVRTCLGQLPPHDWSWFLSLMSALVQTLHSMCLTTSEQWHLMRIIWWHGGQTPSWQMPSWHWWLQPAGRGCSHANSQTSHSLPAYTNMHDITGCQCYSELNLNCAEWPVWYRVITDSLPLPLSTDVFDCPTSLQYSVLLDCISGTIKLTVMTTYTSTVGSTVPAPLTLWHSSWQ